jgi:hypothetical protein
MTMMHRVKTAVGFTLGVLAVLALLHMVPQLNVIPKLPVLTGGGGSST